MYTKDNSYKSRTLLAIYTLWKHTDEGHKISSPAISKYLEPYGLKYTDKALRDTVRKLRDLGIDIRSTGQETGRSRVWWANRPLCDETLDKLVFAVKTNPYISADQEADIMESLVLLVTEFQEEKLKGSIKRLEKTECNENMYKFYSVAQCAIERGEKVIYKKKDIKYDSKTKMYEEIVSKAMSFTPNCVCEKSGILYMFGYNHTKRQIEAVPIEDILTIQLHSKCKGRKGEKRDIEAESLNTVDPTQYINA